jgi:hypothetical protein
VRVAIKIAAGLGVLAAAGAATYLGLAPGRLRRSTESEIARLLATAGDGIDAEQLAIRARALPTPIRWHLLYALPDDVPTLRTLRLKHDGTFRTGADWFPIEGEEHFTVASPGFVWSATLQAKQFLQIMARDEFVSGSGATLVTLSGAVTIVRSKPSAEIDQSAQLRWLMETVWFPSAFVSEAIRWEPIDGTSSRAILAESALPGSAVFEIDDEGKIVRAVSERYRDAGDGTSVLTQCVARCSDYQTFEGFRIPARVEVSWLLESGEFPWARFRVTSLALSSA